MLVRATYDFCGRRGGGGVRVSLFCARAIQRDFPFFVGAAAQAVVPDTRPCPSTSISEMRVGQDEFAWSAAVFRNVLSGTGCTSFADRAFRPAAPLTAHQLQFARQCAAWRVQRPHQHQLAVLWSSGGNESLDGCLRVGEDVFPLGWESASFFDSSPVSNFSDRSVRLRPQCKRRRGILT